MPSSPQRTKQFFGRRPPLGTDTAAVSKSVAQFEARMGLRLFQRSTRSLALTTDGERLYAQVRLPWGEIGEALADLRQGAGQPAGPLKVALAPMVGREYVLPMMGGFLERYPDIVPDLHFDNRQVALVAEGFDVAVGGGIELTDGLISRELTPLRFVLVASPQYLEQHPMPRSPEDLVRHRGVMRRSLRTGRLIPWMLNNAEGSARVAEVRPVLVLDDPEAMGRAAAAGLGLALMPSPHARPLVRSGHLVQVLPDWWGNGLPLSIYYASRRLLPTKVRVFVDHVVQEFKARGWATHFMGV